LNKYKINAINYPSAKLYMSNAIVSLAYYDGIYRLFSGQKTTEDNYVVIG